MLAKAKDGRTRKMAIRRFFKNILWSFLFGWASATGILSFWGIFKGLIFTVSPKTNPQDVNMIHLDTIGFPVIAFWFFALIFGSGVFFSIIVLFNELITRMDSHFFDESKLDKFGNELHQFKDDARKEIERIDKDINRLYGHTGIRKEE
jgi:hypothetical protein